MNITHIEWEQLKDLKEIVDDINNDMTEQNEGCIQFIVGIHISDDDVQVTWLGTKIWSSIEAAIHNKMLIKDEIRRKMQDCIDSLKSLTLVRRL